MYMTEGEPHQSPVTEGVPHQSPVTEGEPHQSPVTEGVPHQSPVTEGEPHQSPVTEGVPHQSPVTEGEPHQSPVTEGVPHQSPVTEGEPHQSPVTEGVPHQSPVTEGEPHQSPVTEGVPHQSPVTEGEPHQSPVTEGVPHQSPVTEGEPHQSPVTEGLTATTPVLTREDEDEHTLSSEACAVSQPLFFTLRTHHAATQELQRQRTMQLSDSLQASPRAPGQTTGVAGPRSTLLYQKHYEIVYLTHMTPDPAQLTATTPVLTREDEDEHTLSSEACAVSQPLFFTLRTHHAATQELQRQRTMQLSDSLQASPRAPGQTTGVAGPRSTLLYQKHYEIVYLTHMTPDPAQVSGIVKVSPLE
ncbi:UNVERIFIED_CONTAM: hypothetical protein FKN15_013227 [Acipenser sinensis]